MCIIKSTKHKILYGGIMKKYKTEFEQPYDITPDSKYFWDAFIKHTKLGNPKAAIMAYNEFSTERKKVFDRTIERDLTF